MVRRSKMVEEELPEPVEDTYLPAEPEVTAAPAAAVYRKPRLGRAGPHSADCPVQVAHCSCGGDPD